MPPPRPPLMASVSDFADFACDKLMIPIKNNKSEFHNAPLYLQRRAYNIGGASNNKQGYERTQDNSSARFLMFDFLDHPLVFVDMDVAIAEAFAIFGVEAARARAPCAL